MKNKIDESLEKAWKIRRSQVAECEKISKQALIDSRRMSYDLGLAKSKLLLGLLKAYETNYPKALIYFEQSLGHLKEAEDALTLARVHNGYGRVYLNLGQLEKALSHFLEALPYATSLEDEEMLTMLLYNTGEIYRNPMINDLSLSLNYLLEAYAYSQNDKKDIHGLILSSLAIVHSMLSEEEEAYRYADLALNFTTQIESDGVNQQVYQILARFYYDHGHFKQAQDALLDSTRLQNHEQHLDSEVESDLLMGKIEKALFLNTAEITLKKAYTRAKTFKMPKILSEVCECLADLYIQQEELSLACEFYKESILNRDLHYKDRLNKHLNLIEEEYRHEQIKKDAEIYRLKNIELKEKSDDLSKALEDLKAAQVQLVQNEKMAALGNLISGIAHEINSPFGAIKGSVANIQNNVKTSLSSDFPRLLSKLSLEQQSLFFSFLNQAMHRNMLMSSKEERAHRKKIARELEDLGISSSEIIAEKFVDLGILGSAKDFVELLNDPLADEIIETVYHLSGVLRNVDNIKISVEKASKVIQALRYYTHFTQDQKFKYANLTEGIDHVLQLFYNQFKGKVDVIRKYQSIPEVECHIDELNQVWMNLIQNSFQAIKVRGELLITVQLKGEKISISFEDNGPGIPQEIQEKIFDPFFTTKKQGQGSGLGLSFVKKTVEKHNGEINLYSQPGCTRFEMMLPIHQKQIKIK